MTLRESSSKTEILVLLSAGVIAGVVLVMSFTPYGSLRATYDSQDLIEASHDLQTYLTGKNHEGHSYLVRAPFHPFLLSFFENKMAAMWWINMLSFTASVFLIFKICRLNALSIPATSTACLITVFSYPWLLNFQFFWTEAIFIVLILFLCYSHLKDWHLLIIILICMLLFLTRKPGIFFFPASAVVYIITKQWRNAVVIFAAGVLTFMGWQWLEFSYGSTGYFGVMLDTLDEYSRIFYLDVVTSWFFPKVIPLWLRTIFLLSVFSIAFYFVRRQIVFQLRQRQHMVMISLAGVYSLIFVVFSGATGYEDAERYLNVVYPLWLITAVSFFVKIVPSVTYVARIFMWTAITFWLSYIFLRTLHHLA